MDLEQLKSISKHSHDINLQKANGLNKAKSDMVLVYKDHIFVADAELINLVGNLSSSDGTVFVLDSNQNPVEIKNPKEFLQLLKQKNQSALNTYHQLYVNLQKKGD